jgi:hypothetical protein
VFDNRVFRRIFGPKRDELTVKWRKLHNEELNDLYFSSNKVLAIKSSRMRWAGHVARMRERKWIHRVWWENLRERDQMGDPGAEGRIVLIWIFRKWEVGGMDWIELGQVAGTCECGNEPLGSTRCGDFLD